MDEGSQRGTKEQDQRCKQKERDEHLYPPLRQKGKDRGWSKLTHFTLESKEFEALVSQTSFQLVDIIVTNECERNSFS